MINKHNKLNHPCNSVMRPDQVSDLNDNGLPLDCPQMPDPCEVQFTLEQSHFSDQYQEENPSLNIPMEEGMIQESRTESHHEDT